MAEYDIILIHPPAIFDFRRKAIFPGAMGSSVEGIQFSKAPIGMLSLAEYLDRHGYRVRIENLGDRMVSQPDLDAEVYLKGLSARVLAVGLHFQQHIPGALETARRCKEYHPDSLIVMGGLTATRFHEEILQKYPFVDAVVRAESEKAFLELMQGLEKRHRLTPTSNLTYRDEKGEVRVTPLLPASQNLDEFEFTRFNLLEPRTSIFTSDQLPRWSLEVCRGCVYNCAICGGSAYTYKKYLGMSKPAFRSAAKIGEDIRRLNDQGIRVVGLYQDPRPAGPDYCRDLLQVLKDNRLEIDRLSLDLLVPADEDFIKAIAATGRQVTVHICPDTGSDAVRKRLGRPYSTNQLVETVKLCHKYLIPVTTFFSAGLAGETRDEMLKTWELWEKLSELETISMARGDSVGLSSGVPLGGPIIGPILLDPGSPAFDDPARYGYKLLYKNLEEYAAGLSGPSWFQWLNYETEAADKQAIAEMNMQSIAFSIEQREAAGFYTVAQAEHERMRLKADILAVGEVYRILQIPDEKEREARLKALKSKLG
jgi:B12-binding domain/radical SAM domain protein